MESTEDLKNDPLVIKLPEFLDSAGDQYPHISGGKVDIIWH